VPTAHAAVAESDIVVAATNTNVPIVEGEWLRPGTHVVSIASGDERQQRRELDDAVLGKARHVIVHSKALAMQQNHGDLAGPVAAGVLTWDRVHDLAALIVGHAPHRSGPDDITVFKNNAGLGLQFAAVGGQVYEDARAAGLGRELPAHWFMETMKP
jgi:ornithine cyclodeaminase/alanine dehydrogenase-like protein (mu-crystallin family)